MFQVLIIFIIHKLIVFVYNILFYHKYGNKFGNFSLFKKYKMLNIIKWQTENIDLLKNTWIGMHDTYNSM